MSSIPGTHLKEEGESQPYRFLHTCAVTHTHPHHAYIRAHTMMVKFKALSQSDWSSTGPRALLAHFCPPCCQYSGSPGVRSGQLGRCSRRMWHTLTQRLSAHWQSGDRRRACRVSSCAGTCRLTLRHWTLGKLEQRLPAVSESCLCQCF